MNTEPTVLLDELDIDTNRKLLNRYRFVEHESMRIMAGWLPKTATFELKCELARALWEDAQHVNALYLRLREIQSPAFQKPADAALVVLMGEMLHAPDEFALALAFWSVLAPSLVAALETHEKDTFPNSDLPSVYAIRHILLDQRAQIERLKPLLSQWERAGKITPAAREWEKYIRALLNAAGGVGGQDQGNNGAPPKPSCRREFALPREAGRNERFVNRNGAFGERPSEEKYKEHTYEEFERYSTEMLAAETVALVLYSFPDMPWEFQYDASRHAYDEVRHCLMGYEWMQRHNVDPFKSPQFLHVFKWRTQFSPLAQYTMLTMGNEVNAFPYRHRRVEAHQKSGDRLSEQFVRYDIADETQHVRFGKRWLPELLKQSGEKRSLEQFIADALKIWSDEYLTGKLPINIE